MAYFKPDTKSREVPLQSNDTTALLFVDTQIYNCSRAGTIYQSLTDAQKQSEEIKYYFDQVDATIKNWRALQRAAREAHAEVMYTVIQSLTYDGRDRGLDYKISGFHVPPGSPDAIVLPDMIPRMGEIVIPKTSSSVFNSTNIHYILGNLGIKQLIICGCVTDQCVEHAVRDACDLNYLVTLVSDACVTYSEERQQASSKAIAGYCRQCTTDQVTVELQQLQQRDSN